MDYSIDSFERQGKCVRVTHVCMDQLGHSVNGPARRRIAAGTMDLRRKRVENPNLVAFRGQGNCKIRTYKPGTTSYKN